MRWAWPAAVLTLLNAAKPAVVDDTAYLLFARHLAAHPLDPYGWELFWYAEPEPAMHVLLPPVLPYWLAAGVALFGEHLVLLKLWLFPFAAAFCLAAHVLLRRFARGTERVGVPLLALSPAVLPLFSVMLDVPAVALGLSAVALFVVGCDRRSVGLVALAGVTAGLAMQTKYTMATVPAVLAWYGLLTRRWPFALVAVGCAVGTFAAWEVFLDRTYGVSHFLHHARDQQSAHDDGWLAAKVELVRPLLGHLGWLGLGWGLFAGRAVGFGKPVVLGTAVVSALGLVGACVLPARWNPALSVCLVLGFLTLVTTTGAALLLGFRFGSVRRSPASWFLVGWLFIELTGYFALTPFPAARRVIGVAVVLGFVACRLVSLRPGRRPSGWVLGYGVALGVGLFAIDAWDARPEEQLWEQAAPLTPGGRVWTQGHWGWQYYADRHGAALIVPGRTALRAGDWLVLPVTPNDGGFYRPYHGGATFALDPTAVERVAELVADDWLAAQTVPNLYGGIVPVTGRAHPRLRVAVYRVTRDWVPRR